MIHDEDSSLYTCPNVMNLVITENEAVCHFKVKVPKLVPVSTVNVTEK